MCLSFSCKLLAFYSLFPRSASLPNLASCPKVVTYHRSPPDRHPSCHHKQKGCGTSSLIKERIILDKSIFVLSHDRNGRNALGMYDSPSLPTFLYHTRSSISLLLKMLDWTNNTISCVYVIGKRKEQKPRPPVELYKLTLSHTWRTIRCIYIVLFLPLEVQNYIRMM